MKTAVLALFGSNRPFAEFFRDEPPARMTMQVPSPKGLLILLDVSR
jgi:hypothetical protein